MPQTPDSGDQTPPAYSPPASVPPPTQSAPKDVVNRSTDYRRSSRKVDRTANFTVEDQDTGKPLTIFPISAEAISGEEYSKVVAVEAIYSQSLGRYIENEYGLIFDDEKVKYGAEPSIIMKTDAVPTISEQTEKPIGEVFDAIDDGDGQWKGVASGGGGGSATGTILKVTEILSVNVYRCSVINNSNDQTEIATNKTLYLSNNTRAALGVNAIVPAILQSDGSYLAMVSLIY